jgi:hypothetical protein
MAKRKKEDFEDHVLIEGGVKVILEHIQEGWNGYYDPEDPEDEPLIRFNVFAHKKLMNPYAEYSYGDDKYHYMSDSSYCTQMPTNISKKMIDRALKVIMYEVKDAVIGGNSIKKTCERLSWLSPNDFKKR